MLTYEVVRSRLYEVKPLDEELICEDVEKLAKDYGLLITQKTTLSTKKGSYHWHFKKRNQRGILEITYWPQKSQFWLDIHDNRRSEWNIKLIEPLAASIADYFKGEILKHP